MSDAPALIEHFFRHEYGRLVASLSRRVGVQNIEAVEDAAQAASTAALEKWKVAGPPEHPTAWLFRVAHYHLVEELRSGARHQRILRSVAIADEELVQSEVQFSREVPDDLLRMLFVCCDEKIPLESQLVLALKVLCGFNIREIALRLFISEANAYKRLARARERLREGPWNDQEPGDEAFDERLPAVQRVLYLIFTEGYLSGDAVEAIRRELCDDAVRLTRLLAEHPVGRSPGTSALLSLMLLHRARLVARQGTSGAVLLLDEQNRSLWDRSQIGEGMSWLARSACGDTLTRYHLEAAIAAEHTLAPSLRETNWESIVQSYEMLERVAPSPLHRINRAIAVAEWKEPAAGLEVLEGFEPPAWMECSYLWPAVLADLHRRTGDVCSAQHHLDVAVRLAPSDAVRQTLQRRHERL